MGYSLDTTLTVYSILVATPLFLIGLAFMLMRIIKEVRIK